MYNRECCACHVHSACYYCCCCCCCYCGCCYYCYYSQPNGRPPLHSDRRARLTPRLATTHLAFLLTKRERATATVSYLTRPLPTSARNSCTCQSCTDLRRVVRFSSRSCLSSPAPKGVHTAERPSEHPSLPGRSASKPGLAVRGSRFANKCAVSVSVSVSVSLSPPECARGEEATKKTPRHPKKNTRRE